MAGFFNLPVVAKGRTAGVRLDCRTCGLDRKCKTPKMPASGLGKRGVLFIAEAVSAVEDARGGAMLGEPGQLLRMVLQEDCGFDLDRDARKINAVSCCVPTRKKPGPTDLEIACCRDRVWAEIRAFNPRVIILLGTAALESFLAHRLPKDPDQEEAKVGSMASWRGWKIPDRETNAWVCPTYHPSYVLQQDKNPAAEVIFRRDIREALAQAEVPLPGHSGREEDNVEVCTDPRQIRAYLRDRTNREASFSFDYETTGLKPYDPGHRIICASISQDEGQTAFAFPMREDVRYDMIQALIGEGAKSAQNMKFEELWSRVILGHGVNRWEWDSMLASHILNNRTRTGLKFQVYARFGLVDYASWISPFLKGSDPKDQNSFNPLTGLDPDGDYRERLRIHDLTLTWPDLLRYCGMDSMMERRLSLVQRPLMEPYKWAYELMHKGALALVRAEENGIHVNMDYCRTQSAHLKRRIAHAQKKIENSEAGRVWRQMYGDKFNVNSNPQLGKVLFGHYGLTTEHKTDSGLDSTGKDSLESLDHPLVHDVLELRKFTKLNGTYLEAWMREVRDGVMHPFYHLQKVVTFRSSSSGPNFQNIPKRDPDGERITRRAIIPSPGNQILEVDFSGIEVRIAACYHKDPVMLKYIRDPSTDLHRDMAMQIFICGPDQWTKPMRHGSKNGFVFPEFYGDYYVRCAANMWAQMQGVSLKDGTPVYDHLRSVGIRNLKDFTAHVRSVEDDFWNNRFKVYKRWKERHLARYHETGEIQLYTGFTCSGIMAKNDVSNYPVQGAAFHCLLWTFTELMAIFEQRNFRSRIIGQIHDSIVMDVHPEEVPEILAAVKWLVSDQLLKHWKWIIVPMDVEAEITGVDEPWYYKKEIAI